MDAQAPAMRHGVARRQPLRAPVPSSCKIDQSGQACRHKDGTQSCKCGVWYPCDPTYSVAWQSADVQLCLCCRLHVPATAWQPAQAITVDTGKGAIDLEPATQKEYAIWVLGLIAALTIAQEPQSLQDVPGSEMLWSSAAFVMSN